MKIHTRGFTLIEVLLYLALFSILIGGAVVCAFNLFEVAQNGGTRTMLSEETDFLLAKIAWALNDAQNITTPDAGGSGNTLVIDRRTNKDGTPLTFTLTGKDLTFARNGETLEPLNNTNVKIEHLTFTHRMGVAADDPEEVQIVLMLSARTPNGLILQHSATSTMYVEK